MTIEIPGQQKILSTITRLVEQDSFPHTTLITGPNGSPLLAVGLEICRILMTTQLDEDKAENTVHKIRHLIHPDVHFSYPLKGPKNDADHFIEEFRSMIKPHAYCSLEDWGQKIAGTAGKLSINVLECNAIRKKLSLKSYEGGNRIMVIWGAEFLGQNGNRLLKLLEEPPMNTYMILIAEDQKKILPTITSRCQNFKLSTISQEEMTQWLMTDFELTEGKSQQISSLSEGSVYHALELIHHHSEHISLDSEQWINAILASKFDVILSMSDDLRNMDKEGQKMFFKQSIAKLRQAYFHTELDKRIFGNLKMDHFDLDFVEYTSSLLSEMLNSLDRNAHVPMLFTAGSMKLWRYVRKK